MRSERDRGGDGTDPPSPASASTRPRFGFPALKPGLLLSGRLLYGMALLGFAALCLGYVDFVHSLQPVPEWLPGYRLLAIGTGLVLAFGALAVLSGLRMRVAGLALVALFVLWIVLLHIPAAFVEPSQLRSPFWIRVFESASLAGAALILAGLAGYPVREQWVTAGRLAFGVSLPVFGALHFIYPESVAALIAVSPVPWPSPSFWAWLTGAGHFAAGIAVLSGIWARPAAILAGLMYASWLLTLHLPRIVGDLALRTAEFPVGYGGDRPELTSLFVCLAFWGAAWIVAGSLADRQSPATADHRETLATGTG